MLEKDFCCAVSLAVCSLSCSFFRFTWPSAICKRNVFNVLCTAGEGLLLCCEFGCLFYELLCLSLYLVLLLQNVKEKHIEYEIFCCNQPRERERERKRESDRGRRGERSICRAKCIGEIYIKRDVLKGKYM